VRHSLLFLYAICACAFGASSALADPASDGPAKVRMAAILPLTGEAASWGQSVKNGMTMAFEALTPELKSKLEIVYEDDALSPKMSVSALQRLLSSGKIDVVFNQSSGTAKALAPILEAKKIPLLAVASDPEVVQGRQYAFNLWVTPEEEARALIPEMQRRGYKRVARIVTTHPGTFAASRIVNARLPKDITLTLDEDYPPDVKDFRSFITKVRDQQKEIDSVMVVLLPGQLGIFARQLRQMGVSLPIFGWETLEDVHEVAASQGALIGAWYVNADDGNGPFLKDYRARYPDASSYCAANGHDAVLLIARAIELGIKANAINEFLATLRNFSGALGTYSATGDQRFTLPARVKIVTEKGFDYVS